MEDFDKLARDRNNQLDIELADTLKKLLGCCRDTDMKTKADDYRLYYETGKRDAMIALNDELKRRVDAGVLAGMQKLLSHLPPQLKQQVCKSLAPQLRGG